MQRSYPRGFSLLEIFGIITLLALLIPAAYALITLSTRSIASSARDVEAVYLAKEGIEAVRMIRGQGWDAGIVPLANGVTYYPVLSGTNWTVSASNPGFLLGRYTRMVQISAVSRDGNGDIVPSGGLNDPNSRLVTATVSWQDRGTTRTVTLRSYLTNLYGN